MTTVSGNQVLKSAPKKGSITLSIADPISVANTVFCRTSCFEITLQSYPDGNLGHANVSDLLLHHVQECFDIGSRT